MALIVIARLRIPLFQPAFLSNADSIFFFNAFQFSNDILVEVYNDEILF